VSIEVYALDQSVRGAYLDRRRGYFNGACLFLAAEDREREAVEMILEPSAEACTAGWRVATAMQPVDTDARGFGSYRASDYDELIDHPVEISEFASVPFQAAGVPHRLVIAGRHESDLARVASDLRTLCETHIGFFGPPPPFDRYWFLGLAVGDGYGGLEHRASSSLIFSRSDLPRPDEPGMPADYQRFLGLVSHEYFHTWHVKRIKPHAFVPYRLDQRNHTRLLWVFEGVTSYYQDLLVLRSGLVGVDAYLARLGELLTRVYRVPGRRRQTLADASFDAWDVYYKPEANSANASVSYYAKGALVALALDLTLRRDSRGRSSLDDVMAELWRRYGRGPDGVPEDGFEALAVEIGGPALAEFFARAVRGTEDLPLGPLLEEFGVLLGFRPATGADDRGGTGPRVNSGNGESLGLGAIYRSRDGGIELTQVLDGGPAQSAGLNPGDLLIALGDLRVSDRNLKSRLARLHAGRPIRVSFFRGDELLESIVTLEAARRDTCYLTLIAEPAAAVRARRKAWLGA
jgi:predicted metalloprotease with PDZ domain